MSGSSDTVHYHLSQIFDTLNNADKADYYRLEPKTVIANADMDNASTENLQNLKEDALSFISNKDNDSELDSIVKKLIEYQQ